MKNWLLAIRPKTLTAALVPVGVAAALSYKNESNFPLWISLCALIAALAIQIATNLLNDAIDFKKGSDREDRIGPVRVTQSGLIEHKKVLQVGLVFLFVALVFGLPLAIHGGLPILIVGICSLFLAYSYTGGPFPLAYLGLGDVFVFIFFGLIAVCGIYFLHYGQISTEAVVAGSQIGLLATVLIAINNLRDVNQDRQSNKKTWAVRFGEKFVKIEIYFLILFSFLLLGFWFQMGRYWAALLPLFTLPVALVLIRAIHKNQPSPKYNGFLAQSALLHLLFGLLLSIGFLIE